MAFVYMVKCRDGTLYTGYAQNVDARIKQHNAGTGAKYTRSRRPVMLVYAEWAKDRSSAQSREAHIKAMKRQQKLALCRAWNGQNGNPTA